MSVEMDAYGAAEGATVQDSQDIVRLVGCNSARGMGVLHQCRMAQRGVQQCEMHGFIVVAQRSERENLSVKEGDSKSGVFLALRRCQSWKINYLLLSKWVAVQ